MDRNKPTALFISLERRLLEDGSPVIGRLQDQVAGLTEAIFLVLAKDKTEKKYGNLRVIPTGSWNRLFYVFDALVKTRKIISEVKIDAVVTQDPVETALIGWAAASWAGAKLIVQDHGYHFHGDYYRKESWLNRLRYLFAKWVIKRADAVRVVSKRTEEALVKLGVDQNKIVRFPVAVKYEVRGTQYDNAPYSVLRTPYFLLAARFVPIKRIDLAIHAFSLIVSRSSHVARPASQVKLLIVGRGPLEVYVKEKIAEFGLADRVEVIPWTDDLNGLYRGAIATLITSDREGFGMTAVESLANGTPVIMTDVGCAGEVIKHGVNGIVVPIGDVEALSRAMLTMLDGQARAALNVTLPQVQSDAVTTLSDLVTRTVETEHRNA